MNRQKVLLIIVGIIAVAIFFLQSGVNSTDVESLHLRARASNSFVSHTEQQLFLAMSEGETHGPVLSYIPDALIEKYRQRAAKMAGSAGELDVKFDELCRNAPAYITSVIVDSLSMDLSILKKDGNYNFEGKSEDDMVDDIIIHRAAIKKYVNERFENDDLLQR